MNVRLFGLAAAMTMAMGVVACGDDTGGAGGAGGDSSSTGDSTSTGNSPASTGTGSSPTSSSSGAGGDDTTSSSSGEGGDPGEGGAGGGGEGGAPSDAPCAEVCADDAGCDLDPADPGDECGACVSAEAEAQSSCALTGAVGPCCSDFEACSDYVNCVLGGSSIEECATDNPDGAARAQACVLAACGDCGSPE